MKPLIKQMYFYIGVSSNQITHEVHIITPIIHGKELRIPNNITTGKLKSVFILSYKGGKSRYNN